MLVPREIQQVRRLPKPSATRRPPYLSLRCSPSPATCSPLRAHLLDPAGCFPRAPDLGDPARPCGQVRWRATSPLLPSLVLGASSPSSEFAAVLLLPRRPLAGEQHQQVSSAVIISRSCRSGKPVPAMALSSRPCFLSDGLPWLQPPLRPRASNHDFVSSLTSTTRKRQVRLHDETPRPFRDSPRTATDNSNIYKHMYHYRCQVRKKLYRRHWSLREPLPMTSACV